jgi:hypothetical protein
MSELSLNLSEVDKVLVIRILLEVSFFNLITSCLFSDNSKGSK